MSFFFLFYLLLDGTTTHPGLFVGVCRDFRGLRQKKLRKKKSGRWSKKREPDAKCSRSPLVLMQGTDVGCIQPSGSCQCLFSVTQSDTSCLPVICRQGLPVAWGGALEGSTMTPRCVNDPFNTHPKGALQLSVSAAAAAAAAPLKWLIEFNHEINVFICHTCLHWSGTLC